jgi:hypothetical protein
MKRALILKASAIDNLLINALQHTPAGGRVELKAAVADRTLAFTVGLEPRAARSQQPRASMSEIAPEADIPRT